MVLCAIIIPDAIKKAKKSNEIFFILLWFKNLNDESVND
jgi:hypothetical protein